jgi:hypothetical protein
LKVKKEKIIIAKETTLEESDEVEVEEEQVN